MVYFLYCRRVVGTRLHWVCESHRSRDALDAAFREHQQKNWDMIDVWEVPERRPPEQLAFALGDAREERAWQ